MIGKRKEAKENAKKKEELLEKWGKIRFFPGSVSEYEKFVGYSVRIVDTGREEMGVVFYGESQEFMEILIEEKPEALVNNICTLTGGPVGRYGLLVARAL